MGRGKQLWERTRQRDAGPLAPVAVFEQLSQQRVCADCGVVTERGEVEHRTPLRGGGRSTADNLVWVCAWCNRHKGTQALTVWQASPLLALRRAEVAYDVWADEWISRHGWHDADIEVEM